MIRLCPVLFALWAAAAQAQTLDFPSNASLQIEERSPLDSYAIPSDVWADGVVPVDRVEGTFLQQAWRIEAPSLTTLQILRPLREQLRNARFQIIFECQTEACGGFDFRFGTQTLPPPEMQINIGDFRFLSARRTREDGPEYITLFVSRTAQAGYVQVTRAGALQAEDVPVATATAMPAQSPSNDGDLEFAAQLEQTGRAVLSDLSFETGSAQLAVGAYASLQDLADYLQELPDRTVALVGHTDSAGGLDGNIALSKQRAGSVLERLVSDYGVNRRQLEAEGMGYLAPVATNLTEEGRNANRRVEVIVTSTQ